MFQPRRERKHRVFDFMQYLNVPTFKSGDKESPALGQDIGAGCRTFLLRSEEDSDTPTTQHNNTQAIVTRMPFQVHVQYSLRLDHFKMLSLPHIPHVIQIQNRFDWSVQNELASIRQT